MSILVNSQIEERIKKEELTFDPPLDKFQLQGHSVDLRLGYTYLVSKHWQLTNKGRIAIQLDYGKSREHFDVIELEQGQYFEILPSEHLIVSTLEKIKLPHDLMAVLYPRSSLNRRGLSVDLSGIIDARYQGNLIVPVRNNTRDQIIRLYPGERFCQLVLHSLSGVVKTKRSRYAKKDIVVGLLREKNMQEMKLIRSGKIGDLKKKYLLKFSKTKKK